MRLSAHLDSAQVSLMAGFSEQVWSAWIGPGLTQGLRRVLTIDPGEGRKSFVTYVSILEHFRHFEKTTGRTGTYSATYSLDTALNGKIESRFMSALNPIATLLPGPHKPLLL